MLLLLMITGKFHMGTLPNIKGFDSYRCIFFALFGFFLFLTTGHWFAGIRRGLVKRTGCVWAICMGMIVVYEMMYSRGIWQNIRLDVLVTTAVLLICMIVIPIILFIMILLASITTTQARTIPLSFLLVAILYIGQQVYDGVFGSDSISQLAHIVGGIVGSVLGFVMNRLKMSRYAR